MSPETADLADLPTLIDLNGRRALVTGGAKGIGAAIAARLAQAGAHVTIADLDPDGRTTAEALVAAGRAASFVLCDITNASQLDEAVRSAADDGALDILVNNAGIFPTTGPIDDVTDAFVERMLEVNVRAQYSASRNAARFMANGGSIVNLASIAAIRGGANITAYTVSKAAVVGLTRAFANELGPRTFGSTPSPRASSTPPECKSSWRRCAPVGWTSARPSPRTRCVSPANPITSLALPCSSRQTLRRS